QIHFAERIVRIEFEKVRKQNLCVFEIALPKFNDRFFVGLQPLQELWIDRVRARTDQREDIDWLAFSFHLHARDRAQMKLVAPQFSRAWANQNIDAESASQPSQSGGEFSRTPDQGWVGALVGFVGPDFPDNRLAVIDSDAERERIDSLRAPLLI